MNTRSAPSLARRERERAETRGKILDAARRMFVLKGYEGTTMRAIAAKIGYTPTAIYHHFKDKDALVAELAGSISGPWHKPFNRPVRWEIHWSGWKRSAPPTSSSA